MNNKGLLIALLAANLFKARHEGYYTVEAESYFDEFGKIGAKVKTGFGEFMLTSNDIDRLGVKESAVVLAYNAEIELERLRKLVNG